MKFAIGDNHLSFFEKNKMIEFEDLFSQEEISSLKEEIDRVISRRLAISKEVSDKENATRFFEEGRDLWRDSETIKKHVCSRKLGELVYQLMGEKPIRMGYDQYYPSEARSLNDRRYRDFLQTDGTLREISSIQGVILGVLIALDSWNEEGTSPLYPFSRQKGNVVFIHRDLLIPWRFLSEGVRKEYYLVAYAAGKSVWILNSKDPLSRTRALYSQGDLLSDDKNPIIFR